MDEETKKMLPWKWSAEDGVDAWRRKSVDGQTLAVFDSRWGGNYDALKRFADEKLRAQGWTE